MRKFLNFHRNRSWDSTSGTDIYVWNCSCSILLSLIRCNKTLFKCDAKIKDSTLHGNIFCGFPSCLLTCHFHLHEDGNIWGIFSYNFYLFHEFCNLYYLLRYVTWSKRKFLFPNKRVFLGFVGIYETRNSIFNHDFSRILEFRNLGTICKIHQSACSRINSYLNQYLDYIHFDPLKFLDHGYSVYWKIFGRGQTIISNKI